MYRLFRREYSFELEMLNFRSAQQILKRAYFVHMLRKYVIVLTDSTENSTKESNVDNDEDDGFDYDDNRDNDDFNVDDADDISLMDVDN